MSVVATVTPGFHFWYRPRIHPAFPWLWTIGWWDCTQSAVGDATAGTVKITASFPDINPKCDYWATLEALATRHSSGAGGYVGALVLGSNKPTLDFYLGSDSEVNDGAYTYGKLSQAIAAHMGSPSVFHLKDDATGTSRIAWIWGTNNNTEVYDIWLRGLVLVEPQAPWDNLEILQQFAPQYKNL